MPVVGWFPDPARRCFQSFERCVLRFRKVATTILAVVNVSLFTAADRVASMRLDIVTIAFGTAPLREGHIISSFTELIVPLSYVRLSHLAISHSANPVPTSFSFSKSRMRKSLGLG